MPAWVLSLNYWFHLVATVVWLGSLATMVLIARPGLRRVLGEDSHLFNLISDSLERRSRPLANVSLMILLITGMIQMSGDSHYEGFLAIRSIWSMSLLAKHILVLGMIVVSAVLQWGVQPALARLSLMASRGKAADPVAELTLRRHLQRLTTLNLALGILVLLFTAVMTAL